ncbi:MAG: efflux RND transporter permease subunit [Planctomycetes bacterium]|nr:efflux RND transporter permease subunit [Planctomycetota bacterium]
MNALILWSVRNRAVVLVLAGILVVLGGVTTARLPVEAFPDLTAPTVTVMTEAPGLTPEEVEQLVTFPIEAALNGASGVRRVRSSSLARFSLVYADFDWGSAIYRARPIVAEKGDQGPATLPGNAPAPAPGPVSSVLGEIPVVGPGASGAAPIELRNHADTVIRRRLLSVPGVAQVVTTGGEAKEFQVWLDPAKLEAYGVSLTQVATALRTANRNVAAGFLLTSGSEYLISGLSRLRGAEDLAVVTVETRAGVPVQVRDLGRVVVGAKPARGTGSVGGEAGVVIGIMKQPDVNTLSLTARLDQVLQELEAELPEGMALRRDLLRQADFIEASVRNVLHALRDGGILVVLILGLFLFNLQATLITLTAIPLSLIAAGAVLAATGNSINAMTLGGLAIAIGALVDDAVIDVENVFRRLRENAALPEGERRPLIPVVYSASVEIRSSIVFATLIIVLVFLPLFFLGGVEGRLLLPLGLAYVAALAASLVVALTVTPVLCSLLLPRSVARGGGGEPFFARWMKRLYGVTLRPVLRHPARVIVPAALILVAALLVLPGLGTAFLPEFQEGALTITAVTLPGVSLEQSDRLGRMTEQILLDRPEVVSVARRTGRGDFDEHGQGVETSEIEVRLRLDGMQREAFLERLRADLEMVPGFLFTLGQPISHRIDHMLSGTRAAVAVKLFGPGLEPLRELAEQVREAMEPVPGVVDLAVEQQVAVPELQVRFDRTRLGRRGLPAEEAAATLEAAFQGHQATEIVQGANTFDVTLRIDRELVTPEDLGRVPVLVAGALQPLGAVAELSRRATPNRVVRENGERKLVVSCNTSGRDLGSVVEEVRERVTPLLAARPGYRVEFGGQFETAIQARQRLLLLGGVVILGIAMVLRLAFGNGRDSLFVMVNLPLALIGGVAGVVLDGGTLSVGSLIGFITVFGIATRNGIMLISHVRHLQLEEGVRSMGEAVRRGAEERLIPILMTALASALALVPLAFSGGEPGSEIQTPMARVILCGLATSTFLNMYVVPALYQRFGRPAVEAQA